MNDSEVLIVGANGQLGTALRQLYPNAQSADIDDLDITNIESVNNFDWSNVRVIINAAAYTNVDGAETPEGRIAAWKVNSAAVGYLTQAALANDLTIVHVSSDYVFDGTQVPHLETEDFSPLGVYAQTKAAGDIAVSLAPKHYLLRSSWVIGEGKNFVLTMKSLAEQGIKPSVVNDQIGRLTFTSDLADAIAHLLYTNSRMTATVSAGQKLPPLCTTVSALVKMTSRALPQPNTTLARTVSHHAPYKARSVLIK